MADFDIKDLVDNHRRGELRDLTMRDVVLSDGTQVGSVDISTPNDLAMFRSLGAMSAGAVRSLVAAPTASSAEAPVPASSASMMFDDAFDTLGGA